MYIKPLFIGDITRYLLALNFLLVLLWWKLAITESEATLKPHPYKGPCCSCPMFTNHKLQYGCTTAYNNASIPLHDDWEWYRRRRSLFTIHYSDLQVLAPLKLLLCGDVETNPGPGEYITLDSVCIQASVCESSVSYTVCGQIQEMIVNSIHDDDGHTWLIL